MGKHNKAIFSFTAAFLVFSMTMTLFLFTTAVKAAILGPKYYYLSVEKSNFEELETRYKDFIKQNYLIESSYTCKANATIGGDIVKSDPSMQKLADCFSKFEFGMNYSMNYKDLKNGFYTALLSMKYDGKTLGNVDIKSADNKTRIAFPELTEKTFGIESTEFSTTFIEALLGDDQAFKKLFGISHDTYDDMVERYIKDVIFKQIPDDKVVLNQDAVFQNIKCNSITFKIDQKVVSDIYRAVAKELGDDKDFNTMLYSLSKAFTDSINVNKSDFAPTQKEIDAQIKSMCEQLNEEADNIEDMQLEYTAYFSNSDEILSRQISDKLNKVNASLSNYKNKSGTDILNLLFEEDGKTVLGLSNELKFVNGSIFSGNFNIDIEGKSLLEAQYTYDKLGQAGGLNAFVGKLDGKVHIDQFNDRALSGDTDISDISFSFSNQKKDNDTLLGNAKVSTKIDGKSMDVTVMTEVKQSNKAISKPQVSIEDSIKMTDYEKLDEIMHEIGDSLSKKLSEIFPDSDAIENFDEDFQENFEDNFVIGPGEC